MTMKRKLVHRDRLLKQIARGLHKEKRQRIGIIEVAFHEGEIKVHPRYGKPLPLVTLDLVDALDALAARSIVIEHEEDDWSAADRAVIVE